MSSSLHMNETRKGDSSVELDFELFKEVEEDLVEKSTGREPTPHSSRLECLM